MVTRFRPALITIGFCVCFPASAQVSSSGWDESLNGEPAQPDSTAELMASPSPRSNQNGAPWQTTSIKPMPREEERAAEYSVIVPRKFDEQLNQRIADFVRRNLGNQVGNGECWTLADEALRAAGAQPPKGYACGRPLLPNEEPLPGDIIRFTRCRFVEPSGAWTMMGEPEHIAIILRTRGSKMAILHQNNGSTRTVQKQVIDFRQMVSGRCRIYRPESAETPTGALRPDVQD